MKLVRSFIYSAGAILLVAAYGRFLIATGNAQHVLSRLDPMLGIPLRYAVLIVGAFELTVAWFCLFGRRVGFQLGWLAWLSTNFIVFWIGLIYSHCPPQGTCIGSLTDPLHLSHGITGSIVEFIPFCLVLGSYAAVLSFWLSADARSARLVASQQSADLRDAAAGLLKMLCPSCGGHVNFPAQNMGQQIPCPHCQAAVTPRKSDNLKMTCFFCKEHIEFPAHALGQKIKCPHCKNDITLKEPV